MRELILNEIRRIAALNGGKPPGKSAFETQTAISESKWAGVYWSKWSDALVEAGFSPNAWRTRLDTSDLIKRFAAVTLKLGHLPTIRELKLLRRTNPEVPSPGIIHEHFRDQRGLNEALRDLARTDHEFETLADIIPEPVPRARPTSFAPRDGYVYLIRWEERYKVGRSDDPSRALKEIRAQLPSSASIVHTIKTDDPVGIEAYWHRRFADKRLRGEWFDLSLADVKAFQRRRYQ